MQKLSTSWALGFAQGIVITIVVQKVLKRWQKRRREAAHAGTDSPTAVVLSAMAARLPRSSLDPLVPLMSVPDKNIILAQGVPPQTTFPLKGITFSLRSGETLHLDEDITTTAQRYAQLAFRPLIEWCTNHMKELHNPASQDWMVSISGGSMSSVDLVFNLLVNPGDTIFMEEFTFMATMDNVLCKGLRTIPVRADHNGLIPEALEEAIQEACAKGQTIPKVLYVIPVGQNPTGSRLLPERYQKIYQICLNAGITIIEDDPYFYLQHNAGKAADCSAAPSVPGLDGLGPSFLRVDTHGIVVRLDSFSKLLAPGFRVGWVTGPRHFIKAFTTMNTISAMHGSSISITILHKILSTWGKAGFDAHVRNLQETLRARGLAISSACKKHLHGVATWNVPDSGMFLWLRMLRKVPEDEELFKLMQDNGVVFVPGSMKAAARANGLKSVPPFARLSYVVQEEVYDEAVRRIRQLLDNLPAIDSAH